MLGSMMKQPLLLRHTAQYHGDTEIVSKETAGEIDVTDWAAAEEQSRRLLETEA